MNILAGVSFAKGWMGTVHSVFDKAVNIEVDGEIYTIVSNLSQISHRGLYVPMAVWRSAKRFFTVGDPVRCEPIPKGCIVHTVCGDLLGDGIWHSPALRKLTVSSEHMLLLTDMQEMLNRRESELKTRDKSNIDISGIVCSLFDSFVDTQDLGILYKIVGAGVGLTPSGDDMLVGYCVGEMISVDEPLAKLRDAVTPLLSGTNIISRWFVSDALNGNYTKVLFELAIAFVDADRDRFKVATEELLTLGSSSGYDTLYGFNKKIRNIL